MYSRRHFGKIAAGTLAVPLRAGKIDSRINGVAIVTFDPPIWAMFERKQFWEAHRVMLEREYYHLENMSNFDQLPPHSFKLSLFPIKWVNTTAAPVRAVAIVEE